MVKEPQRDNTIRGGSDLWDTIQAGVLLTDDYFESPSVTGRIKVWLGSWLAKPVKWWNGASWVTKPVKRWNGSSWVTTSY